MGGVKLEEVDALVGDQIFVDGFGFGRDGGLLVC